MRRNIVLLFLLISVLNVAAQSEQYFTYIFPKPGAKYVSETTTLIFRFNNNWNRKINLSQFKITINGQLSGDHEGRLFIANDHQTIIYEPFKEFVANERVDVSISFDHPDFSRPFTYCFTTSKNSHKKYNVSHSDLIIEKPPINTEINSVSLETKVINGVSVPADFPLIQIDTLHQTAPGKLFLANYVSGNPYIAIFENDGTPYFYRRMPEYQFNFKRQPSGTLSRKANVGIIEMDSNYVEIDTLLAGNGRMPDIHDFLLLEDGTYYVSIRDEQVVDMSELIEIGDPRATVIGYIVERLNRNGEVLFRWRSWDYLDILDALHIDFSEITIDCVHLNAIDIDYDGHLLLSCRSLSQVLKIDKDTGQIIWRFGGNKTDFELLNDEYGISYQHDIRAVPGTPLHYTVFDNGNYHIPQFSRAFEFSIDTTLMTATKVWEYRNDPDYFGYFMGNVQRLPNGNTLINWGDGHVPKATEVTPEGEVVYEMNFIDLLPGYRTFRTKWEGVLQVPYLIAEAHIDKVVLIFNKFGDEGVSEYRIYGRSGSDSEELITSTPEPFIYLTDLENFQTFHFRVTAVDSSGNESGYSNEETVFVKYLESNENLLLNGDFSQGSDFWNLEVGEASAAQGSIVDSVYHIEISSIDFGNPQVQLEQNNVVLIKGETYLLEFDTWATTAKIFDVRVQRSSKPHTDYSMIGAQYAIDKPIHYSYEFIMESPTDFTAQIIFDCRRSTNDLFIDNVSIKHVDSETSVENLPFHIERFNLHQNFPNPFNSSTVIAFNLPSTELVKIEIFNIIGQRVKSLLNKSISAGYHKIEFDAHDLPSGVYFYRIEAGQHQAVKKMLLLN